jgi:festuclavine dehydrogenase
MNCSTPLVLINCIENFSEQHHHVTIREEDKIYSGTAGGKIPFVSADDIAVVAYHALTDLEPHNRDHLILGPELLSYDNVCDPNIL